MLFIMMLRKKQVILRNGLFYSLTVLLEMFIVSSLLLQFTATGLMIIARNYLDVYPYDRWNAKVNFITEILCQ